MTTSSDRRLDLSTPLYAAAGLADLAYEQARTVLDDRLAGLRRRRADVRGRAERALRGVGDLPDRLRALPDQLREFPQQATVAYHDLAGRGRAAVDEALAARRHGERTATESTSDAESTGDSESAGDAESAGEAGPTGETRQN